ncbi:MAG TPA: FecR domain-containing protein [Polyangiaceae bacterium]|jgi:hypothetical protein|nr:FecR domain-containing protein [Polyangiaceae bacterium]
MSAPSRPSSTDTAASALGRLLYEGATRHEGARQPDGGVDAELERLLQTVKVFPARSTLPPRLAWALVAAAAVVVAFAGTFAWRLRDTVANLTFSANGVRGQDHVAITAEPGRAVDLAFSDGSVFDVEPAARLRVDSSSATGARLTLVDGKTVAHVVHRARSSWSVSAGPFEVQVTGTRFGASWDAGSGRLSVELYEGSVQVVGGGFAAPISVRAGQRLEAGREPGNWVLTSLAGPSNALASTASPANAPPLDSAQAPAPEPSNAALGTASTSRLPSTFDWPALLGRADFEGIVRQANDLGIERCLSSCASSDLRMLADSARYLGRYALAERSLLALRKRSPSDGASAAFLLGRLEEPRDPPKALIWYEKSLAEAPAGPYAADARAGRLRLQNRAQGNRR